MAGSIAAGEVLSDRFELLDQVGRGGMGTVWRARDRSSGDIVAIKLLHGYFADNQAYRDRFAREVELARRVSSPRIARVLGFGAREGVPFLVLEFVEGTTLAELIRTHGPYTWPETRTLLLAAARALADVHAADVVHRDVKPSNIMVTSDGRVKLTDFGIARALDLARLTGASTMLGTPAYLAPEGQRDERSDLYALGVVAYEVLVGEPPFAGDSTQGILLAHINTPPDLNRIPAEARPLVGWLLAKDPNERPPSANSLIATLEGTAPVPPLKSATHQQAGRNRTSVLAAIGALAVLGVLAVVVAGSVLGNGASSKASPSATSSEVTAIASAGPTLAPSAAVPPSALASTAPSVPDASTAPTPVDSAVPSIPLESPSSAALPNGTLLAVASWPAQLDGVDYPANWYANGGFLYSRGNQSNDYLAILPNASLPNIPTADYTITARVQWLKNGSYGFAVRATDVTTGYFVSISPEYWATSKIDVNFSAPSGKTTLAQGYQLDPTQWHTYVLAIAGDKMSLSIDGHLIGTTNDSQLTDPGAIALTSDSSQIKIGTLTVTTP